MDKMHIMRTISMPRKQTASSELHLQNHLPWNVYYKTNKINYIFCTTHNYHTQICIYKK